MVLAKNYMKKLKILLLYDKFYLILVIITFIYCLIIVSLKYESKYDGTETNFLCMLTEYEIDGNKLNLSLICKEKLIGTYYIKTEDELKYLKNNLKLGIELNLNGTLTVPKSNSIFYGFNYKEYLYNNKIYYLLDVNNIKIKSKKVNLFYKLKNLAFERTNTIKNKEYIYSFVLGKSDYINDEILDSYRYNGISHLFALSGLHVSVITSILKKPLKKLRLNDKFICFILFVFLLLYSFITGFSPSILRAIFFFILLYINKIFKLKIKTLNIFYFVLSILLIINPFNIFNISFIMSFSVSFFLIIGTDKIKSNNYFIRLFKVSLLSTISTIPISIYYFGYASIKGIILNIIYVPYVTYIVFPLAIITFILPIISPIFNFFTILMEQSSVVLNSIKLVLYFPKINSIVIFIYFIMLFIYIKSSKKIYFIGIVLIILLIKIYPYIINQNDKVFFLDQTTTNMIQRLNAIFKRNPLKSKGI